jgi:hypothetical protein
MWSCPSCEDTNPCYVLLTGIVAADNKQCNIIMVDILRKGNWWIELINAKEDRAMQSQNFFS